MDKENTFIDKVKNDLESAKTLVAKVNDLIKIGLKIKITWSNFKINWEVLKDWTGRNKIVSKKRLRFYWIEELRQRY